MQRSKWEFRWALAATFLVLLPDIASGHHFFGQYFPGQGTMLNVLGRVIGVLLACLMAARLNTLPYWRGFHFLGLKSPDLRQLLVGLLSLVPLAICYGLAYRECLRLGVKVGLKGDDPLLFVFNLTYEEILFRGFIFQCLRPERSFWRAAFLSGILFSLPHFGHLLHQGLTTEGLLTAGVSAIAALLFSFPSAYVFERGGNVLWGYLLVHIGIDSINYLEGGGPVNPPLVTAYVLGGIALTLASTFPLANWLLPMDEERGWLGPSRGDSVH